MEPLTVPRRASALLRAGLSGLVLASSILAPTVARAQEGEPPAATDAQAAETVDSATPAFKPLRVPFSAERLAQSDYGMNVFVWGNPQTTRRDLDALRMAGIGWQKSLFQWRAIEAGCKYCFDWTEADRVVQASNAAGIKVIARVDFQPDWTRKDPATNGRPDNFQDFADFMRVFADRYKAGSGHGRVDAVEIWNEPNLQREWGAPISRDSAKEYVQMLGLAYTAIKSKAPEMQVVTAGLSPTGWDDETARPDDAFLQWMFDGGLKAGVNYDVLGLHGNSQVSDPAAEVGSVEGMADPSFYFRRVEQLRAIQEANGDAAAPVWLVEFGWTSDQVNPQYSWFAVSEEQKAQNIVQAFQYARANWPWMQVMTVWAMPDPAWGPEREEYWWSVSNPDGTPRPALDLITDTAQQGLLP